MAVMNPADCQRELCDRFRIDSERIGGVGHATSIWYYGCSLSSFALAAFSLGVRPTNESEWCPEVKFRNRQAFK